MRGVAGSSPVNPDIVIYAYTHAQTVSSKTISLHRSAYEKLRAARGPNESFSDVVHRTLSEVQPSFRSVAGVLDRGTAEDLRRALRQMRHADRAVERQKTRTGEARSGRHH